MIELTNMEGKKFYIRASAINMICTDKDGTVVCYGNDMCYMCKESMEEVLDRVMGYMALGQK